MIKPLMVDLFCGLGGATEGFLAEGWDCIGVDIEQHIYGQNCYPAQLWVQDILTISGSQLRNADFIWASPPCQAYSWMAMPWSRAKTKAAAIRADTTGAELERLNRLFNACFRIQREACEAAGRHIPMVVENVRGAELWVGRARWAAGSMYLWGDVPALMPIYRHVKVRSFRFDGSGSFQTASVRRTNIGNGTRFTSTDCGLERRWFNDGPRDSGSMASMSSKSPERKFASAMIAKIPEPLSRHIARVYHP